ncbi:hypothetical protein [Clostridium scatologenes]|uniref:Uncharacterized protein n=1 Tax=Clostridium scatologenes TaxID=1548 RepID=A0A0E3JS30_CLOSL|nr:hypothetical protein [Clostridium scatologenes]AKA72054.1 hypothetical protein CSCA_4929 [Clostridium scatologenes]
MENVDNGKDKLDELIEAQIVIIDEEGLPVRTEEYSKAGGRRKNYSPEEIVAIVLPYVYENITVSDRKLAECTNLDRRTISKCRKSELFKTKLAEITNDKLLNLRCMALDELEKMLKNKNLNDNTRVKVVHEILQHSVSVAELAVQAGKEVKPIDINVLLKELEDF